MSKIDKKYKIALLFSSGSLVSIKANKSIFFVDQESDIPTWFSELPEVALLTDITPIFLQGEKEAFSLQSLNNILRILAAKKVEFDGFVVLVRAESMVLAAAAAKFTLKGFNKPVIFTGSRYSPEALAEQDLSSIIKSGGLGLRSNLINAIQVASNPSFKSAAIMFGNKLIDPAKAVISDFRSMNLFRSFDETYLGKVDFGISLNKVGNAEEETTFTPRLSEKVCIIGPSPLGITHSALQHKNNKEYTTLLLHIQANEKIAQQDLENLRKNFKRIVLFNQHYVLQHDDTYSVVHMSWAAAVAKVLWADAAAATDAEFGALIQDEHSNNGI